MEVSTQYLINAMTNFEKKHPEALKSVTDGASAEAFVLYFLEESEINFYFKKTEVEEDKKGDEPGVEVKKADDLITSPSYLTALRKRKTLLDLEESGGS